MDKETSNGMVTTKTIHELDYSNFEKIVESVYGKEYNFIADEEMGNDSSQTYNNIIAEELDEFDKKYLEEFKEIGNHNYLSTTLLTDLVNQGYLPEGNYVIKVCW